MEAREFEYAPDTVWAPALTKRATGPAPTVEAPKLNKAYVKRTRKVLKRYGISEEEYLLKKSLHKRNFDRGVGAHGTDRDKLPESDFAGPHRSFPIVSAGDVSDAMHLSGHAADPDSVRSRIRSIAHRKGFPVPGEKDDGDN